MTPPGFLNRFVLPKVALGSIGAASFLGATLTMATHGAPVWLGLVRWAHLVALGVLAGGGMWLGGFVRRPADPADVVPVARFVTAARRRFQPLLALALGIAAVSACSLAWLSWAGERQGQGGVALAAVLATAAALTAGVLLLLESPDAATAFRPARARATCAGATLALLLTALLDARLTFSGSLLAALLRPLHVVAFGLWLGGAVWNIFVVVPAAQETLALPVVVAAAQQLERFRWVVRVILPTLVLTGLAQALPYTGWSVVALVSTPVGFVILGKLLLVVGLLTIFVTCPMWRGCSPIRGMCDLDDLETDRRPEPTRTLDHRGRGCGGFVHVRQALADLAPGDVLELLSSDAISWQELPRWLARRRYTLLHRERHGRLWWRTYRYLIEKPGPAPSGAGEVTRDESTDRSAAEVSGRVQARA